MRKPLIIATLLIGVFLLIGVILFWRFYLIDNDPYARGVVIDSLDNVTVFDNGPVFIKAHGKNYATDGYYFGQKWQCVEFIKRYLYTAKGLKMPDVWGHAIDFFDGTIPQGELNNKRGMIQYRQNGMEKPQTGDLIVFSGAGGYGHVAIISMVTDNEIEIVQQNSPPPRLKLGLIQNNGYWKVDRDTTLGWLRVPAK